MTTLSTLRPIRPQSYMPPFIAALPVATNHAAEIEQQARALGLFVTTEADDQHHATRYIFTIAEDEADPLYVAQGVFSAFRFLDRQLTRN